MVYRVSFLIEGIKIVFRCLLHIQSLFHCKDDVFDLWYTVVLQNLCIWHGDVHTGNSDSRSIQIIKRRTYSYIKRKTYQNR